MHQRAKLANRRTVACKDCGGRVRMRSSKTPPSAPWHRDYKNERKWCPGSPRFKLATGRALAQERAELVKVEEAIKTINKSLEGVL